MIRLSPMHLEDTVLRYLHELPPSGRPRVLGIGGHPYTGKSHLAHAIQAAWRHGGATILPTESTVLPRTARLEHGTDGCSPAGHDMRLLFDHIAALCDGRAIVCREYSWATGDAAGTAIMGGLGRGDLLIIDGSVVAASPIAQLCDLLIVLSPLESDRWLPLACQRDVVERGWEAGAARAQNERKARTSASLGASLKTPALLSVQIDPVSWSRFVRGYSNGGGLALRSRA